MKFEKPLMFALTLVLAVACAFAMVKVDNSDVRAGAGALFVLAAGALKTYLPKLGGKGTGAAALFLAGGIALSTTACDIVKPKTPIEFAQATCIAANAFLDVAALRAACGGLDGVPDEKVKELAGAARSGGAKAGACAPDAGTDAGAK